MSCGFRWLSIFDAVGFVDIGNVFPLVSDFRFSELRKTAGFGLRLRTPSLMLRFDYGFKLDRRPGESRVLFSSVSARHSELGLRSSMGPGRGLKKIAGGSLAHPWLFFGRRSAAHDLRHRLFNPAMPEAQLTSDTSPAFLTLNQFS